ncbi:tetratricopeptide repeat protein [Actinomyces vulturis]|uniref:tetratricopeptide repeat protein n=1 Tax=Actinomyces vulturis TaxID=1857645 RepID=UPI00082E76BE|nr:hypothetical protein [Actinomyces vulturis]
MAKKKVPSQIPLANADASQHDLLPPTGSFSVAPSEGEDPRLKAIRLARRKSLLLWSTPIVFLVLLFTVWLGAVNVLTFMGRHQAIDGDHHKSAGYFDEVADINPILEQWRVHFNQGTMQAILGNNEDAERYLRQALHEAPGADMVATDDGEVKNPYSPECMIRGNLLAVVVSQGTIDLESDEGIDQALELLDGCPLPQSSDDEESSDESSPQPSDGSTSGSQDDEESDSESSPSPDPQQSPSPDPNASPTSSSQSDADQSPSPSPSPSPDPNDPMEKLRKRNEEANGNTNGDRESSVSGDNGKRW